MFSLGILGILQALSCLATIWGVMHVQPTTEAVVTYGVGGEEGVNYAQLFNSYGALALGIIGWISTHFASKTSPQKTELVMSIVAWLANRTDTSAKRRAFLAMFDVIQEEFSKDGDKEGWQFVRDWLFGKAVTGIDPNTPAPKTTFITDLNQVPR
jgi:hypothetical protein